MTYQAEPCDRGVRQSEVAKGTMSVVDGRANVEQLARLQAQRPEPVGRQETVFTEIATAPVESRDYRCHLLLEAVERVDELGRRPNKSYTLERLRTERRELVEEMYEFRCPRIP